MNSIVAILGHWVVVALYHLYYMEWSCLKSLHDAFAALPLVSAHSAKSSLLSTA